MYFIDKIIFFEKTITNFGTYFCQIFVIITNWLEKSLKFQHLHN